MSDFSKIAKQLFDRLPGYTAEELAAAKEKKRRELARDLGLCRFDCTQCGGLGYIRVDEGDGLQDNYRVSLCPNVNLFKLPSAKRFGITEHEVSTLSWDEVYLLNGIEAAIEAVQLTITRGFGWVYLWGSFGLGKTLVLKTAVAQYLRSIGKEAAYIRMVGILDYLKAAFDDPQSSERERLDWLAQLPLLAIDEVDKLRGTEYAEERRFVLMDKRYEQAIRQEGITLFASNADPGQLPGYFYDRVQDGRFMIVKLEGPSLRPGMEVDNG